MNVEQFRPPPNSPLLEADEVHVWRAWTAPRGDLADLEATLAFDERRRADRFHFPSDRQRFVAARGVLRRLLGRYLKVAAKSIAFHYGPQGKPELDGSSAGGVLRDLSFNLAHSGDLALYGFARGRRLGIDVERLRDVPEALVIARNHFTPAESRCLHAAGTARQAAFFRLWTRKEAVIKAVGTGVSTPLNEFDVSSAECGGDSWQCVRAPSQAAADWRIRDIPAAAGYCAALAIEDVEVGPSTIDRDETPPVRLCFWEEPR